MNVSLDQFEGSLEHLVQLLQRREVDAAKIVILDVIRPFRHWMQKAKDFDAAADFILLASHVAFLKSKSLLPLRDAHEAEGLPLDEDPKFEIIHHLIDYCRFKEAAHLFSKMEGQSLDHYPRGLIEETSKLPLGLTGITLDELGTLFQEILKKSLENTGTVKEEEFRVQDKIAFLRHQVRLEKRISLLSLLEAAPTKIEKIVIFLSVLELIKIGEIGVAKTELEIVIWGK